MENRPLVLGSTSRYRSALLVRLGIAFATAAPGVDEAPLPGETPAATCERLAQAKARAVAARYARALVIGSDQVADAESGRCHVRRVDVTTRFRRLSRATIEAYVDRERPFDCAGSIKSEGLGIALVEAIENADPTALIGLPLIAVVDLLQREGVDVVACAAHRDAP